jgi:hypothetical protein
VGVRITGALERTTDLYTMTARRYPRGTPTAIMGRRSGPVPSSR